MPTQEKKTLVLIIEDEPALRDIYTTKLGIEGFDVVSAPDGVEGLDKAIAHQPDIIILDIILPIKDGFEVLKDLKGNDRTKHIPVVIMSNLGQPYEVKRGVSLGAEDFLTKASMTPLRVTQEVRRILDAVRARKVGQ